MHYFRALVTGADIGHFVIACAACIVALGFNGNAGAATVFVSPSGSDGNDGSVAASGATGKGPVATLSRALEVLRAVHGRANAGEADRIVMSAGRYQLSESVRVGPPESRPASAPLTIEAAVPGTVTLSGGQVLKVFADNGKYWTQQVSPPADVQILWVDGKLGRRARGPKGNGFYQGGANVRPPVPEPNPASAPRAENRENLSSLVLPAAARKDLARLSEEELRNAVLVAMHAWTSSTHEIARYDPQTGRVDLKQPSKWPFFQFGGNQRFAIENAPALLDEPGEWVLTTQGELRYLPLAGQRAATTRPVAAGIEHVLQVAGSPGRPVENVTFRGLRFMHSGARAAPYVDSQAAADLQAAVMVDHARNIAFEDCAFEQIGGYAIWFRRGVSGSSVRYSLFRELGGGAIRIGEGSFPGGPADFTGSNKVENNLVTGAGKLFPGAVGVWVGQSGDNRIAHNEIRALNYTGISVGWTWGFGKSAAQRNRIESNFIHHVGQGVLSDLSGIYLLGPTAGSVVRENRIEDVHSFDQAGATAWGIYLDEGASDVLVERNMVRRTTGGGFHLHYGENNVVRNNIFMDGKLSQAARDRKDKSALTFELNVLAPGTAPAFLGEWSDPAVVNRANLVVRPGGAAAGPGGPPKAPAGNFESTGAKGDPGLQCDRVNCKVVSRALLDAGFANFSAGRAGIQERRAILRGQ